MIGNTTNLVPNKASSNRSPSSLLNNDHLENRYDNMIRMDINGYCEDLNKNNNAKMIDSHQIQLKMNEHSSIIPSLNNNKTVTNQTKKFNSLYEGNGSTYLNDNKFKNKPNSSSNNNQNQNRIGNNLNLSKSGSGMGGIQSKNLTTSSKSSKMKSSNSSKNGKIKVGNNLKDDHSIKSNELDSSNNNQLSSTSNYNNLNANNNPVPLSLSTLSNKKFNNRLNYPDVTNNVSHQNNNVYTTMNSSNGIQNILVDSPVSINSTSSSSSSSSISSSTSTPPPTFYQPNQISTSSILRAALQKPGGLSTPPTPTATPNQTVNNTTSAYNSNFTNQRTNNKCPTGANNSPTVNNTNSILYPLNYQNSQCFNFNNNQLDYSGAYNAANKQHQSAFFNGHSAQPTINPYNNNNQNNVSVVDNPFYPQPIPSSAASPSSSSSSSTSTSKLISSASNYQSRNNHVTPTIKSSKSPQLFHSLTSNNVVSAANLNYQGQIINPSSCQFYSNEYYPQQSNLNNMGAYQNFNHQNLYNPHNQHPLINNNVINSPSNRTSSLVATTSSNPSSSSPLYYDLNQHLSMQQSNYNTNSVQTNLNNSAATNNTGSSMDEFNFQDLITNSNNNYVYNSTTTTTTNNTTNPNNSTPAPIKLSFFN